ncbi:alcohol dehydrogenase catalytic domain-containing protein [Corynebacterium sp.]|uniref:alcohol dehydrogenase catalytic domain-containing protein n=1 Tax=Corynebacterium sp. TaxID=1720 RepID=UPI0028AED42F|nr:alcohol dehydrogenase catalytic domain-containing protein [Corynebacterium sp.]
MKAITVEPGKAGSLSVEEFDAPTPGDGQLLVRGLALGVCGTDHDLNSGGYGWAPEGHKRLIIGHESLGEVISAPEGSGFKEGDHVVGVVRRPDPEPCGACAWGEFDMCRNGKYRERGIKEIDGFGSEQWVIDKDFVVKVDNALGIAGALLEPTSVVAKAWDQVDRLGNRAWFEPSSVVVTGAGPLVGAALTHEHPYPVICLLGIREGDEMEVDIAAAGKGTVLNNTAVVGSVNTNVDHWRTAAEVLGNADRDWLSSLITRKVPLSRFAEAFEHQDDDIKVLSDLQS